MSKTILCLVATTYTSFWFPHNIWHHKNSGIKDRATGSSRGQSKPKRRESWGSLRSNSMLMWPITGSAHVFNICDDISENAVYHTGVIKTSTFQGMIWLLWASNLVTKRLDLHESWFLWTVVATVIIQYCCNKKLSYGRDAVRSLILFGLTSSVICKIMHKIGFLDHPMKASGAIYALYLKFLTKRNLVAEFHRENVSFTHKTAN